MHTVSGLHLHLICGWAHPLRAIPVPRAHQAGVSLAEGGGLQITTVAKQMTGPNGARFNYSSGWVDTKGKWSQYLGRFEANCSLPTRRAEGVWPAFWLMPANISQCWPTGGEIDIFEMNGNAVEDSIFGSYHWAKPAQCGHDLEPIPGAPFRPLHAADDWQTDYHVYGVEWRTDRLDFYVYVRAEGWAAARADAHTYTAEWWVGCAHTRACVRLRVCASVRAECCELK